MKEMYAHWLRLQCETWLKDSASELFGFHYARIMQPALQEDGAFDGRECLISRVNTSVGPWEGVCFHFKAPGEAVSTQERNNLSRLREQGCLVLIVRCLEDFRMMVQTYFASYLQNSISSVTARFA